MSDRNSDPLIQLQAKQNLIKDRVTGVAIGFSTGFYLSGRAGIAKTTIVQDTLADLGGGCEYRRGYSTTLDLFNTLDANPSSLHVLDDIGGCLDDPKFMALMLPGLECSAEIGTRSVRLIRYGTGRKVRSVRFSGGIILISNSMLTGHPPAVLAALKERIDVLEYDPTDEQMAAVIREIAEKPQTGITKREARQVASFLLEACVEFQVRPTIRLYVRKALRDFLGWKQEKLRSDWRDLVRSTLGEQTLPPMYDFQNTKAARDAVDRQVVLDVWPRFKTFAERFAEFTRRTKRSKDTMYRVVKKLKEEGQLTAC